MERIVGARGKSQNCGAHSIDCDRGIWGNVNNLYALRCVLGTSEVVVFV